MTTYRCFWCDRETVNSDQVRVGEGGRLICFDCSQFNQTAVTVHRPNPEYEKRQGI